MRQMMAIDLGPRKLRALLASSSSRPNQRTSRAQSVVKIQRSFVQDVPADLDAQNAEVFGAWLRETLHAAGFPRGRTTMVISREHVAIRRLTLPTPDGSELPSMTRLAMQRDLPFDAESAVIDFVPVERTEKCTTVLAVAAPRRVIDWVKATASAAGLSVERLALRTMGAVAVANSFEDVGEESDGVREPNDASDIRRGMTEPWSIERRGTLVIDVRDEGIELCVVQDGTIRTSRAAEVPPPYDRLAIVEAVVTEARRTWMSSRAGSTGAGVNGGGAGAEAAPDVQRALIMGDRRVCEYAAEPLSEMLGIPVRVLDHHPRIVPRVAEGELTGADQFASLAGVLLESLESAERIDLSHPRQQVDAAMQLRRRRFIVAAAAVVALGGALTAARLNLQSLERRASQLVQQQRQEVPAIARYWRDAYKLEHLKRWEAAHVNWLDHAMYLATIAPSTERLVLDSWTGGLDMQGVKYEKTTGKWSVDQELTIVIDGEAKDRETADGFRAALVQSKVYAAATPGTDARGGKRMPFGFTYRLKAREVTLPQSKGAESTNAARADADSAVTGGPS